MGTIIARQPNGLLCRYSTVVDDITDDNLTEEDYIELCAEQAREDAKLFLALPRNIKDFKYLLEEAGPFFSQSRFKRFMLWAKNAGATVEELARIEEREREFCEDAEIEYEGESSNE